MHRTRPGGSSLSVGSPHAQSCVLLRDLIPSVSRFFVVFYKVSVSDSVL